MNPIKAVWNERTNILSFLNTSAILLVAYVLWVQIPHTSRDYSSELSAQTDSINRLTARLDHPLNVQSETIDKLMERLDGTLNVTISNETYGKGILQTTIPFKVDANVEGKVDSNVEGGLLGIPVHIENPLIPVDISNPYVPVRISNP